MMPMTFTKTSGGVKYVPLCDVCGGYARFGFDVRLIQAIDRKDVPVRPPTQQG